MNTTNNQTSTYNANDFFDRWQKTALPRYKKIKVKKLISLIRKDREKVVKTHLI